MLSNSHTMAQVFTCETKSGKQVSAEIEGTIACENNHGADADGNRGIHAEWLDEIVFVLPLTDPSYAIDDNGAPMTDADRAEAEELLTKQAESYDWFARAADDAAAAEEDRGE